MSPTDDVLARRRERGMTVHAPASPGSLHPSCDTTATLGRYGAWIIPLEVAHVCTACVWPTAGAPVPAAAGAGAR